MAKGEQRGNREVKKPKASKPTVAAGARSDNSVKSAKTAAEDRGRPKPSKGA